jgi:hypothetical protein
MARGGYREGSGRSKQGHYKGIYCGSTYELCWAIHALDHGIKFSRFPTKLEKDGVVYHPDFLLEDGKTIIEPKGYESSIKVEKKVQLAESLGYTVKVMKKDDLKYAFEYVTEKYNTKKFHTLYDGYKPKYNYVCAFCNQYFCRDNKLKRTAKEAFCSKSCAGKKRLKENRTILKKPNSGQFGYRDNLIQGKLTKEQALYVFNNNDLSFTELAKKFNIATSAVSAIKQNKSYRWIHDGITPIISSRKISSNSFDSYVKEKLERRINYFLELLKSYKKQNLTFKNKTKLVVKISNDFKNIYNESISRSAILDKNRTYKDLINQYLEEQSQF